MPWLRQINRQLLRDGVLLGTILFLETACALTGLETISASRSAFIVCLNVVIVPLLSAFLGKPLHGRILLAAGLAAIGMSVMSWDGGGLSLGDALTMASAVGIAIYILLLESIAPRHNPLPLAATQVWFVVLLGGIWALPELLHHEVSIGGQIPSLLYIGLVVTIGPLWGQAMGQWWVPAHEAALPYTLRACLCHYLFYLAVGRRLDV
ncbi:MAG: hypothetical protein AAFQ63_16460 [Cyanobacteria bacterium J06621_11]